MYRLRQVLSASSRSETGSSRKRAVPRQRGAVFEIGLRIVDPSKGLAQYNGFHGNAYGTCISQVGHARVSMLERSWPRGESLPLWWPLSIGVVRVIASPRVYVHGYSSLMREGSRLRNRDSSRDQSAAIYFLRGDACRPFLFLSAAEISAEINSIVYPNMWHNCSCKSHIEVLQLSGVSRSAELSSHARFGTLNARPYPCILPASCSWHTRALLCLICIANQKDWMACARQMFDSSLMLSIYHIMCMCLLSS